MTTYPFTPLERAAHGALMRRREANPRAPRSLEILAGERFLIDAVGWVWTFHAAGSEIPNAGGQTYKRNCIEMWAGKWRPGSDGKPVRAVVLVPIEPNIGANIIEANIASGFRNPLTASGPAPTFMQAPSLATACDWLGPECAIDKALSAAREVISARHARS